MKRPALSELPARVDLVIVGGGITGAGVLEEAARTGASVLLVEQGDFASGTSSGSSKLVHGGLRYLKTGQWRLTLESVREREALLRDRPDLVQPQPFLMPIYRGGSPGRVAMRLGLWLYDRMADANRSSWVDRDEALRLEPALRSDKLLGGMLYEDARTDDAQLTLRTIFDSLGDKVLARNYTRAERLLRDQSGRVRGVALRDMPEGWTREIEAGMVILGAGAWSEGLASASAPRLRPLRGSHFIFPREKLPLGRAVSWLHPADRRPIFAYPWEGATLFGTTDVDHDGFISRPRMGPQEATYLIEGLAHQFPSLNLTAADALSTYAAVRPVVAGGKADPSAESRESATWSEPGLVGLAGGKLTTYRHAAKSLLTEAARQVPALAPLPGYAAEAGRVRSLPANLLEQFVVYLDDWLLRRTREGLLKPYGAQEQLPGLRDRFQRELGWSPVQWSAQQARYLSLWREDHSPTAARG